MKKLCKQMVKDQKASTWDKEVLRNCQMKANENGYCTRHDPDEIARQIASDSQREIIKVIRESNRKEESAVGLFMRLRRQDEFYKLLQELKEAEEVAKEMRIRDSFW